MELQTIQEDAEAMRKRPGRKQMATERDEKWWAFVTALIKAGIPPLDAQALADHPETWVTAGKAADG